MSSRNRKRPQRTYQEEAKPVKKRARKGNVEQSKTVTHRSTSRGGDLIQPLINSLSGAVVETEKKKVHTVPIATDTSEPHTVTTTQSLPLSGQGEATDTAKSDDQIIRKDPESYLENLQPPVQPVTVDIVRPPEATTTPPAIGTVSGSHCEEQTVVEVKEKKLLIVADTSRLHSTATESSREDDNKHKGTSDDSQQEPRAQDESDRVSKKPVPVQKKRHKRTRRHGE